MLLTVRKCKEMGFSVLFLTRSFHPLDHALLEWAGWSSLLPPKRGQNGMSCLSSKYQNTSDPGLQSYLTDCRLKGFELLLAGPMPVITNIFPPLHHLASTPCWFATWMGLATFILHVSAPAGGELHAELLCVAVPSCRQLEIIPGYQTSDAPASWRVLVAHAELRDTITSAQMCQSL